MYYIGAYTYNKISMDVYILFTKSNPPPPDRHFTPCQYCVHYNCHISYVVCAKKMGKKWATTYICSDDAQCIPMGT